MSDKHKAPLSKGAVGDSRLRDSLAPPKSILYNPVAELLDTENKTGIFEQTIIGDTMIIEASKNYALLLQLKAAALLVFLSFLSGAIAAISLPFAVVFGITTLALYLLTALFYIRLFVASLSVCREDDRLIIKKGVIIERTAALPILSVRYFRVKKTPLSALFGICTVSAHTSSGRVLMFGLDKEDADRIISCTEEKEVEKTV